MQCIVIIGIIIIRPFNYKRHELKIFRDFEHKFNKESQFDHQIRVSYLQTLLKKKLPIEFYVWLYSIKKSVVKYLVCLKDKKKGKKKQINMATMVENMDDLISKMNFLSQNIYDK